MELSNEEKVLAEMEKARFELDRPCLLERRTRYRYLKYSCEYNSFSLFKRQGDKEVDLGDEEYWRDFKLVLKSPVPTSNCICTDGSCLNNGTKRSRGRFRIVKFDTGEILYDSKTYLGTTNNVMEYMGLLESILICRKNGWDSDIYTDSIIAMYWLYRGSENSRFKDWMSKEDLIELSELERLVYSVGSDIETRVMFWDNLYFCEIPADLDNKYKKEDRELQVANFIEGWFAKGFLFK